MRVCVVGAGPCGLTTVKQLRDEGHEVVCYDKYSGLGGIWLRDGDDDGTKTKAFDNPKLFTQVWFGSFNPSASRTVGPHSLGKATLKDLYSEPVEETDFMCRKMSALRFLPSGMHPKHQYDTWDAPVN